MVEWLHTQGVQPEPVNVYWFQQQEGVSLQLGDFLDHLDELWFPASDDVVVESRSGEFVIVIDHEEQLDVFARANSA